MEGIEVERGFEIVQETNIGQVEHAAEAPEGTDIFAGPAAARLAQVSTQVSSGYGDAANGPKHFHLFRFSRLKR